MLILIQFPDFEDSEISDLNDRVNNALEKWLV